MNTCAPAHPVMRSESHPIAKPHHKMNAFSLIECSLRDLSIAPWCQCAPPLFPDALTSVALPYFLSNVRPSGTFECLSLFDQHPMYQQACSPIPFSTACYEPRLSSTTKSGHT